MGNYTKGHSAGIYQHLGWVGRNSKPFSTLRNMYYGNAYESLHVAVETAKERGVTSPQTWKAVNTFLALQATYGVMAGLSGLIFYKEAEWAYEKLREFNPSWDLPPFSSYHREVSQALGPAAYGVLGAATGADIGTSVGAPSATEGLVVPGAGVAMDASALAFNSIKSMIMDLPPPEENSYKYWRRLAPNTALLNPMVEYGKKIEKDSPKLGKALQLATVQGTEEYYAQNGKIPFPSRLEGMVERSKEQSDRYKLWGSMDLKEKEARADVYASTSQRAMDTKARANSVKSLADAMLGYSDADIGEQVKKAMEKGQIGSKKDLMEAVRKEIRDRGVDQVKRDLDRMAATNPQRASRAYKLMEQMGVFNQ